MNLDVLNQKDVFLVFSVRNSSNNVEGAILRKYDDGVNYWIGDYLVSENVFEDFPLLKEKLKTSSLSLQYQECLVGELSHQERVGGYKETYQKVIDDEVKGCSVSQVFKSLEQHLKLLQKRNMLYMEQEIRLGIHGHIGEFMKLQMEHDKIREYWFLSHQGALMLKPGEYIPEYYFLKYDRIQEYLRQNYSLLLKCVPQKGMYEAVLTNDLMGTHPFCSAEDKHILDMMNTLCQKLERVKK